MNSAIERLLTLRVRDIMNREVVTIDAEQTMGEAAAILQRYDITGAPVVNSAGHCVGVISASDFAIREKEMSECEESGTAWSHRVVPSDENHVTVMIEAYPEDRVSEHMSPVVQTISQEASLVNASRVMCGEHIHRLLIIDDTNRPVGVISSLDLIAAMVAAIEE